MSLKILLATASVGSDKFAAPIVKALKALGLSAELSRNHTPETVDYIVYAPNGPVNDFSPFSQLKAVLSLWAGVEKIVDNPTLNVPLTRMVDSGLREGMVEWVVAHVLRYHLGIDRQIADQNGVWNPVFPPLARQRKVAILGLGALGAACARGLADLNFQVTGWSRSPKHIDMVTARHGAAGLKPTLQENEIFVLLLPQTPATENLINETTLALMPRGAQIINPGRGTLIKDRALLEALDTGQIGHATLDVFRCEPLPPVHPYWSHPNVTVTPHVASETRADTAAALIAENIRLNEAGKKMKFLVDRNIGY